MDFIPFEAPAFAKNPHFQTIATHLLQKVPGYMPRVLGLVYETAIVPTLDGNGDQLLLHVHRFHDHDQPAVLLVHGLEGSADSHYIVKMTDKLLGAGFHVVRMNLRSCGAGRALARTSYHCGLTIDIEAALQFMRDHVSRAVAVVGFSLGSNLTLKYMGEDRSERDFQIAARGGKPLRTRIRDRIAEVFCAVSIPLDIYASCEYLDSENCRVYRDAFMADLKKRIQAGKFDQVPQAREEIDRIQTWFDFDHYYVAASAGYRGAVEYYTACSSKNFVPHIKQPGLLLHAHDDPLIHPGTWEEISWKNYPHLTAEITEHGGHLGWLSHKHPYFPDRRWMDYRVLHYLLEWKASRRLKSRRYSLFSAFSRT